MDELGLEAEFDGQLARPWLLADPSVGTAFEDEAAFRCLVSGGLDNAAEAITRLIQMPVDGCALAAVLLQLIRGGETGDAAADDGDALHPAAPTGTSWRDEESACSPNNTCSSARISVGESFRLSARHSCMPRSFACCLKSMSMS